jgi:hypothetical protein
VRERSFQTGISGRFFVLADAGVDEDVAAI